MPAETAAALPPLTDAEIAKLRKLHEAGTSVPWTVMHGQQRVVLEGADILLAFTARNALPRLLDFAERARKLLLAGEWIEDEGGWHCPTCRGYKPGTGQQDQEWVKRTHPEKLAQMAADKPPSHKPGCELAALLGLPRTRPID